MLQIHIPVWSFELSNAKEKEKRLGSIAILTFCHVSLIIVLEWGGCLWFTTLTRQSTVWDPGSHLALENNLSRINDDIY